MACRTKTRLLIFTFRYRVKIIKATELLVQNVVLETVAQNSDLQAQTKSWAS